MEILNSVIVRNVCQYVWEENYRIHIHTHACTYMIIYMYQYASEYMNIFSQYCTILYRIIINKFYYREFNVGLRREELNLKKSCFSLS